MRILVACEESQAVTTELRKLGHEAYSCDIEECSGEHKEWHIKGDVSSLLDGNCIFVTMTGDMKIIEGGWDMIIGFPPCTYLSNAGACRLYPKKGVIDEERYKKGLAAKEFFLSILNANCRRVAVENPVSSKIFNMPQHSQEIQPYYFGDPYTKKTRLWLKGLPHLVPTDMVESKGSYVPSHTSVKTNNSKGYAKRGDDAKNRSKTFPGIARAMAEQWTKGEE